LKSCEKRHTDTYKQHGDRIRRLPSSKTKDYDDDDDDGDDDDNDDDRTETVEIDFA